MDKKQMQIFVDWYKNRYIGYDIPIEYTSVEMLGIDENIDYNEWRVFVFSILKKSTTKIFKMRVLESLRLNYGPKCKESI